MSSIVERLKEYIDSRNISVSAFEKSVGMGNASFGKSLKTGGAIGTDKLENILNKYADLSPEWLLTGEGDMIRQATAVSPMRTFPLRTDRNVTVQEIPLYDFDASAGLVAIFNDMHPEPVDYLKIPNLPTVDGAIYVRGDSMSPLLKSGDIVMYKKKELSVDSILWGEIYLLSFTCDGDSYTAVKYIRKSDEPGKIRLASFNPSFAPKDIPMDSVTALALVKASLTFHTME